MSEIVNTEKAQEVLNSEMENAKSIIDNPEELQNVLNQVEAKLAGLPVLGNLVNDLPVMVDLLQNYISKKYTAISPKVILSVVGAFLYIIKKKDIIPDSVPLVGMLDDIAVVALALQITKPELKAFTDWKVSQPQERALPQEGTEPQQDAQPRESTEPQA